MVPTIIFGIVLMILAAITAKGRSARLFFGVLGIVGALVLTGLVLLSAHIGRAFGGFSSGGPLLFAFVILLGTVAVVVFLALTGKDSIDRQIEKAERDLKSK